MKKTVYQMKTLKDYGQRSQPRKKAPFSFYQFLIYAPWAILVIMFLAILIIGMLPPEALK